MVNELITELLTQPLLSVTEARTVCVPTEKLPRFLR